MTDQHPKMYLYRRIVQAKLFIDEHFADKINLDDIADEAHFSKYHFIRIFNNIYGRTPHQHLMMVRIEKAKLLLQADKSIADVCFSVGFDSVSSFASLFKRNTSVSPSAYRQQQRLRKYEICRSPLKYIPDCFAKHIASSINSNFQEGKSGATL